jgi:hypothetical protein
MAIYVRYVSYFPSFVHLSLKVCAKVLTRTLLEEKSFAFTKHHDLAHAPDEIRRRGSLRNANTRVGEGVHQEVKQSYGEWNFKNVVPQVSVLSSKGMSLH